MSILQQLHGLSESEDWGDLCDTYKRFPADVVLTELKDEENEEE